MATAEISNPQRDRLIIVSNRLPITLKKNNEGTWSFSPSSGGLVSALSDFKKTTGFIWVGWPGFEIPETEQGFVRKELNEKFSCIPVFLNKDTAERFYDGFSNSDMPFVEELYEGYKKANALFATEIMKLIKEDDIIWIHDYQLMLLPQMLRQRLTFKNVSIAFFLHIPFPSSDLFRVQPAKEDLLNGLLGCDMIGFHTYDYSRHFLSSCNHIFGMKTGFSTVELPQRFVHVGIFPIGIDPEKFTSTLDLPEVKQRAAQLKDRFKDYTIIVGVDRLDYIKGLPHKLTAFESFLETNPEWIGKIILIQIAVPSRQDVEEYRCLRKVINEMVGRINGKFATIDYCPIHFVYNSLDFKEMVALYSVADICLVTSTRDGMNLVSYEFIASQAEKKGTLILSEFTGAAQSLNGALIVNPWDAAEVAQAILEAVTMSEETRLKNYLMLSKYVNKFTAARWGLEFTNEIKNIRAHYKNLDCIVPTEEVCKRVKETPGRRFVFLACDSAISPYNEGGEYDTTMSKEFIDAITRLAKCKVLVYVMSAEKKSRLEELFPDGTVGLSAELGCFYKHPCFANIHTGSSEGGLNDIVYAHKPTYDENHATNVNSSPNIDGHNGALSSDVGHSTHKWISLVSETESSWKKKVMPIFELYAKSIPQSRLEDKDINVVWHSKSEDQTHRSWQALELKEVITNATMNMFLTTFIDNKKLILKPTSTDRCIAITSILQDYNSANEKLISYRGMPYRYKISSNSILQTNTSDRQPDTAVKINDDDICILASDSRYEDEQFQSLFGGININTVKSPFKAKAVRPRNAMMFFVGGKKHAGAQYYLDDTRSLINLLNFIAASLSQSA